MPYISSPKKTTICPTCGARHVENLCPNCQERDRSDDWYEDAEECHAWVMLSKPESIRRFLPPSIEDGWLDVGKGEHLKNTADDGYILVGK